MIKVLFYETSFSLLMILIPDDVINLPRVGAPVLFDFFPLRRSFKNSWLITFLSGINKIMRENEDEERSAVKESVTVLRP